MTKLKNLKNYNERLRERCPGAPYVYISEHLPKKPTSKKDCCLMTSNEQKRKN